MKNGIKITFKIKPGAKLTQITEIRSEYIGLQIAAPPRDGEANQEVIDFLVDILDTKKKFVQIISGHKSRDKIVFYETEEDVSTVFEKFKDL